MTGPIHNDDRDVIELEHERFVGAIGDAAISMQDNAYKLGVARERKQSENIRNWSVLAYRAMDDAHKVLETLEGEDSTEAEQLEKLQETLRELCTQALVLHSVLSRRQMDDKYHFQRIDLSAEGGAA